MKPEEMTYRQLYTNRKRKDVQEYIERITERSTTAADGSLVFHILLDGKIIVSTNLPSKAEKGYNSYVREQRINKRTCRN
jgi:hypothetical protein